MVYLKEVPERGNRGEKRKEIIKEITLEKGLKNMQK